MQDKDAWFHVQTGKDALPEQGQNSFDQGARGEYPRFDSPRAQETGGTFSVFAITMLVFLSVHLKAVREPPTYAPPRI